jgi:hypothetical protein
LTKGRLQASGPGLGQISGIVSFNSIRRFQKGFGSAELRLIDAFEVFGKRFQILAICAV